ncbi:MAG: A/G-specific adenine glycosylase, partial [Pirellulaceae bacterium]
MDDSLALPFSNSAPARRALARQLHVWFLKAARDLPWRRTKDLYAIWISEVMLQQTQVVTVIPYFERFLGRFPDVAALAAADEQEVLRLWEGLGYYRRARQLHAAARQIVAEHRGRFPQTFAAVRSLPGIGRYTAGAVLSIGLDARLPILEANTIRVLSRLAAFRGDPTQSAGQKRLWSLAEAILPARDVGIFNQALMELGSEICTPKAPACDRCPVRRHCLAYERELQDQIPVAARKTKYEEVTEAAVVVRRGGRVLVRQCQPGERWAGLWDFPRFAARGADMAARVSELTGVAALVGERFAKLRHGVTRFRITLDCYEAKYIRQTRGLAASPACIRWVSTDELAALPLSTTGRKIARLVAQSAASTPPTRKKPPAAP